MRVAVDFRWRTVGGPTSVCNTGVRVKQLGRIKVGVANLGIKLGDLAYSLDSDNLALFVAVNGKAGRVIAAVFETLEA